jgi:cytoskeletal protein CcmA (bactofilin family)
MASAAALVGRGTARAAEALTIDSNGAKITNLDVAGSMKIDGSNTLEFGAGVNGKQGDAGKIGYQTWTTGALDIVGAGTANTNRKIKLWAEGGATVAGDVVVAGTATAETFSGNDATLKKSLTVEGDTTLKGALKGPIKIDVSNALEFGAGVNGKQVDAGKIGYQTFTTDALDIVGAGNAGTNRKIKFWAEGGATFNGSLNVSGNLSVPGGVETLRMLRGIVNGDGNKVVGEGFTVRKSDTGLYDITFDQGFPSVPGASVTQIFGMLATGNAPATATGSTSPGDFANIVHLSADRMRVGTWTPGGRNNRYFSLIVIGPR